MSRVLTSLPFLTGLSILLLNDFVLKAAFHNWITGKLSDFAGLFVFPLFFSALLPRRRDLIYTATTIAFVIWKSTYSQPVISVANNLLPIPLYRTEDFTDIIAIAVLPISWTYARANEGATRSTGWQKSLAATAVCLTSIFAFAATSTVPPEHSIEYSKDYKFELPAKELAGRLEVLDIEMRLSMSKGAGKESLDFRSYMIFLDDRTSPCDFPSARADVTLDAEGDKNSTLHLKAITYYCESQLIGAKESFLKAFETRVIEKLRTP